MAEWATAPGFLTLQAGVDGGDERQRARRRLDRLFEIALFLLIVTGFIAIAGSGALDGISVALVSMALLVRGWFVVTRKEVSIPERWDIYFSLGYVVFYVADFFFGSRGFIPATVHLVLFSMVVKLFSIRRDRDYLYLAVLAFLQILAACVLTVDPLFVAVFAVFAVLAVFTFVTFEIRRSWAEQEKTSATGPQRTSTAVRHGKAPRLTRSVVRFSVAMSVGILAIASILFFVLPRVSAGYLAHLAPKNQIVSGFSEQVRLGQIGEIQQSSAVVMHVELAGGMKIPAELYWRGLALSLFDGRQWFNPLPRNTIYATYPGRFELGHDTAGWTPAGREMLQESGTALLIRYRVLMEPIGTNVFFFVPYAVWMEGDYRNVSLDAAGAVFNSDRERPVGIYVGVSDLGSPRPDKLRAAGQDYPAAIALRNLQLPPKLDRRIATLTQQVTAQATNPYDQAIAIERFLRSNFTYTLQLNKTAVDDPLSNFLFERKQGHCEYFASAMAVMLRTLGIPSRVVNGFRGGEFNPLTGSYIVRAREAHSWVEAYFPGSGWVRFDPTPPSSAFAPGFSRFDLYLDAMREFWREWVVNYDFMHQRNAGVSAAMRGLELSQRADQWTRDLYFRLLLRGMQAHSAVTAKSRQVAAVVTGLIVLLLIAANWNRLRRVMEVRRAERRPGDLPESAASLWFERMCQVVARRGWRRLPSQTAAEFLASISEPNIRERVAEFNRCYAGARFGSSSDDAERLATLFEAVRLACASQRQGDSANLC